ncbi:MarR family winged helix-turn-helix transcriptional regulator [Pikeienuella sp. HZG-20]|uniref:MarR family winged helix-turn-helix transcriptional regulator n=1 Tax=Paludibacillus litoralis TaxID=3133267 RepID=UPI0030ECE8B7
MHSPTRSAQIMRADQLLFLKDEQLRSGIELLFFAYRDFTSDPDRILVERGYGRAHHRAIHFIRHRPGLTVAALIEFLGVTKQSLNRVLRQLIADGLVEQTVGATDRRQRLLHLTGAGRDLEAQLSETQRERLRRAYLEAGPEAVAGFREVLHRMMDKDAQRLLATKTER